MLLAEGLEPTVDREGAGFVVRVAEAQAERAAALLALWEREQEEEAATLRPLDAAGGLALAAALGAAFLATGAAVPGSRWLACGGADSARILAGEVWRTLTALTLHADPRHLFGNALAAALLFAAASAELGRGGAALLALVAGAAGNSANAWLHGPGHLAVGASTALFGLLGGLAGLAAHARRRRRLRGRRALAPLGAGLALLALLGTGGDRVDLWAHACGLGAGLGLGAALAPRPLPGRGVQLALLATCAAALAAAWLRALR